MSGQPPSRTRLPRRIGSPAPKLQMLPSGYEGLSLGDWLTIWRTEPIAVLRESEEREADRISRKWGHLPLPQALGLLDQEWRPGGERIVRGALTAAQLRMLEDPLGDAELVGVWPGGASTPSAARAAQHERMAAAAAAEAVSRLLTTSVAHRGAHILSSDEVRIQRAIRAHAAADVARETREHAGAQYIVERLPDGWRVARRDVPADPTAFDVHVGTLRQAAFRLLADTQHTYSYSGADAEVVVALVATLQQLRWAGPVALAAAELRQWSAALQDISFGWRHAGGRPLDSALTRTRIRCGLEVRQMLRRTWRGEPQATATPLPRPTLRRVRLCRLAQLAAHGQAHPELDAIEFANLLAWRLPADAVRVAWVSERCDAEAYVEVRTLDAERALSVIAAVESGDEWLCGGRRPKDAQRTACAGPCDGHVVRGGATRHLCPPLPELACAACEHRSSRQSDVGHLAWLDHHPDCPIGWAAEAVPLNGVIFPRA